MNELAHAFECWAGRGGECREGCSCPCHRVRSQAGPRRGRPREDDGQRIEQHIAKSNRLARHGEVWISQYWFEMDAYGAAVQGILKSIEAGLASGSIGRGAEEEVLKEVRARLVELDPEIQ